MAHREFLDDRGRQWEVWDVRPERRERRSGEERRRSPREKVDRRQRKSVIAVIGGSLANGWLAFTTKGERRRYAPLPENWVTATDEQLLLWLAAAKPLPPRPRLIE
jgi:hypothetical protein